jgi:phosphocarrier protein
MSTKITRNFIVKNELGLHARPSASFVKKANEFDARIEVIKDDGNAVNGKSIMSLMCLAAGKGVKLTILAEGHDALEAIHALGSLFKNKFGEN